ncbi:MAG: hypothetical protein ACI9R3_003298 [Verrucomicrobiales bacterium]|jgi:hypothetical protein
MIPSIQQTASKFFLQFCASLSRSLVSLIRNDNDMVGSLLPLPLKITKHTTRKTITMKTKLASKLLLAASLFTAALSFAAPAKAQSIEDVIALEQLQTRMVHTAATYASSYGWYLHDFEADFIREGSSHSYAVHLDAGDQVVFRAMGDADALDVDLKVVDSRGRLIRQDVDGDETPFVSFTARRSGTYTVQVSLPECTANGSYCGLIFAEK